jgi:hypothetical protein
MTPLVQHNRKLPLLNRNQISKHKVALSMNFRPPRYLPPFEASASPTSTVMVLSPKLLTPPQWVNLKARYCRHVLMHLGN